jgi:hypothetical protein
MSVRINKIMEYLKPILFIASGIILFAIGQGIKKDDDGLSDETKAKSNEILKFNKNYSIRSRIAGIISLLVGLYFLIIKML